MVIVKDGKRVVVTDHAATRYAARYERGLGIEEARTKLGVHIMKSSAKRLVDKSPAGDPLMLLPELDCVVVIKPDDRPGHEENLVVPTVLDNPERKVNRGPMYDKIAALSNLRATLPEQAAAPVPPPVPPPVLPPPEASQPSADWLELQQLRRMRDQLDALAASLRKREQHIRVSVAGIPENLNLQGWADRHMTLAVELGSIGDEVERLLAQTARA